MSVINRAKEAGAGFLGCAVLIGLLVLGIALLTGLAEFSLWILEWTFPAFLITLAISIFILGPLAFIPPTRVHAAFGFLFAAMAFTGILWVWSMAYTYLAWGVLGVIVGLVVFGVGVVPVAMVASVFQGDWGTLGIFIATIVLSLVCRGLANWLGEKADERAEQLRWQQIEATAREIDD